MIGQMSRSLRQEHLQPAGPLDESEEDSRRARGIGEVVSQFLRNRSARLLQQPCQGIHGRRGPRELLLDQRTQGWLALNPASRQLFRIEQRLELVLTEIGLLSSHFLDCTPILVGLFRDCSTLLVADDGV